MVDGRASGRRVRRGRRRRGRLARRARRRRRDRIAALDGHAAAADRRPRLAPGQGRRGHRARHRRQGRRRRPGRRRKRLDLLHRTRRRRGRARLHRSVHRLGASGPCLHRAVRLRGHRLRRRARGGRPALGPLLGVAAPRRSHRRARRRRSAGLRIGRPRRGLRRARHRRGRHPGPLRQRSLGRGPAERAVPAEPRDLGRGLHLRARLRRRRRHGGAGRTGRSRPAPGVPGLRGRPGRAPPGLRDDPHRTPADARDRVRGAADLPLARSAPAARHHRRGPRSGRRRRAPGGPGLVLRRRGRHRAALPDRPRPVEDRALRRCPDPRRHRGRRAGGPPVRRAPARRRIRAGAARHGRHPRAVAEPRGRVTVLV